MGRRSAQDVAAPADRGRAELFDEAFLKKLEYLSLVAKRVFAGSSRAERRTRKIGSGIEFADHREYSAGDDFRYLDWNLYGRLDRLLLRLFEEEEDLYIYLLIDVSDSMLMGTPPKLNYAAQLCAALCYVGLANLDRVSIVAFSDGLREQLPAARGKGRIFKVFDFLRQTPVGGATNLAAAMRSFVHQSHRRGVAVLLSDLYDDRGFEEGINLLRYNHFEPLILHITDPIEANPQLRGDLRLIDCETGAVRDVTISPKVLAAYADAHARYVQSLRDFCTHKHVAHFVADTTVPFDEMILTVFRRGGFLR